MPSWKKVVAWYGDPELNSVTATTYVSASEFRGPLVGTSSFATSASFANFANTAGTASYSTALGASLGSPANNQVSLVASNGAVLSSVTINNVVSSSYALTASYAENVPTALTASYALTASSANDFNIRGSLTGSSANFSGNVTASNLLVNNTITAQTLIVQVITSSTEFVTGSTIFGSQLTDTHQFTGSVTITGSLGVNGVDYETTSASFDSRILTNSASIADLSSSYASLSGSFRSGSFSGSFTGSFNGVVSGSFSGSLANLKGQDQFIPVFTGTNMLTSSIMYQSGSGIAINETSFNSPDPEALYVFQTHPTSINVISGKGNINNYLQLNVQNTNQGVSASSDVVATADNGSENGNYIDMGINGENYATNFIGGANDAYLYASASNLHIGNASPGSQYLNIFVGGTDVDANRKIKLTPSNIHEVTGSLNVSNGITSSLFGTSSWAQSASVAPRYTLTSSFTAFTASYYVDSASFSTRITTNSSSISLLSSSFTTFSGSYNTGSFTGTYTGSFSGSFFGDGSGITNISASSVVGLNLSLISSGSVTASTDPAYGFKVNSNTQISGSTQITGSLGVTGSVSITGSTGTLFTANVDTLILTGSLVTTGSIELTGSMNVLGGITSSLFGTSSWAVSASHAPSALTSSYALTASFAPNYTLTSSFTAFTASYYVDSASFDSRINNLTESVFTHIVTNSGASNYIIDGVAKPILSFVPGATYRFNTAGVVGTHPFKFSTSPNGPTEYTTGVTSGSNYIQIEVNYDTPTTLYYYCTIHNGMGNAINVLRIDTLVTTSSFNSFTSSYYTDSASFSTRITDNSSSISLLSGSFLTTSASFEVVSASYASLSGSFRTGSYTGSFIGTGSYSLSSLTSSFNISSSYASSSTLSERTTQVDIYVKNSTGVQINKGVVVRIIGAVGDNPLIQTASYENDNNSANTLGITTENIANDSFGYVVTEGILKGIDTSGYTAGQLLYLGPNGTITGSAPVAPLHSVRIGEVLRVQLNNGSMYVRIDNGYELGELHDVRDTTTTSSYGDLLVKSGSVWTNSRQLTGSYAITGSLFSTQITASNLLVNNSITASSITAQSASFGYVQTITGSAVIIGQEYIILNTQAPASRYAGLIIYDSGSNETASLVWDSVTNHFVYQNAGTASYSGGGFIAGPRNTGSLADITYPTQYRVVRGQGGDHIYDSNIIDNDIKISLGIDTEVTGSLIVSSGITGSLLGTATSASNAISASYALTASYVQNAQTASYVLNAVSASYSLSSSYSVSSSHAITASYAVSSSHSDRATTSSYSFQAVSASYSDTSSLATTASYAVTAAYAANVPATASYALQALSSSYSETSSLSVTASYAVTAAYASNVPETSSYALQALSSSYALTASFALNGGGGGISAVTVADEGIIQGSASYFDFTGATVSTSVTNGTASINILGGSVAIQGASSVFTQSLAATTWSLNHAINSRVPVVEIYDSSFNVIIPTKINNPGPFLTDIYFDVAQSGYAIISTGGNFAVSGSNAILNQTSANTTWSFQHDLQTTYPVFTIFDSNDDVIIPQRIHAVDSSSAVIYFSTPRTGKAVASVAGPVTFSTSSSLAVSASYALSASYSFNSTTASYAVTAAYASNVPQTSSYALQALSSSYALTASFAANVPATASYALQALSSSYALTASFASNVPATASYALEALSSSYALTASYISGSGGGVGFPFSGSAVITGSLLVSQSFVDLTSATYVTGSFTGSFLGTGSYATFALSASNAPGFTTNFTQSSAQATWSFVHNLNTRNPLVQVYDTFYKQIVPNEIVATDHATVEIRFDYNQAGYAVASNGGGLYITGSTSRIEQSVAATTWSFQHNLNTKYPTFEVYDSNDNVIVPAGIKAVNVDSAEIYFAVPSTGKAIANFSGINGLQDNAVSASYAQSGSNFYVSNTIKLNGTLTDTATVNSSVVGSNNLFTQATGSYTSAFFKYTVANGANARSGEMMAVWNGASIEFTDNSTADIGSTSPVTASVVLAAGDVEFNVQTNTGGWKIKSIATFM